MTFQFFLESVSILCRKISVIIQEQVLKYESQRMLQW